MTAQTQTTLAIIYSHQSALKYVDSCCVLLLSAYTRRDCVRRFESRLTTYKMLALNSSRLTFFCGRYGYSFWPIRSFRVADVVVADMVCGRYRCGRYWSVADMVQTHRMPVKTFRNIFTPSNSIWNRIV